MIEKLNKIFEIIKEVSNESPEIGDILLENFKFSMDMIESIGKDTPLDVSEKIELVCKLTGVNLEELVINIIQNMESTQSSDTMNFIINNSDISPEECDKEAIDFIINNSDGLEKIDDYEKFLKEAKADMEFLKKNI